MEDTRTNRNLDDSVLKLFSKIKHNKIDLDRRLETACDIYTEWKEKYKAHPKDNNSGPTYFTPFGFSRDERSYLQKVFIAGPQRIQILAQLSKQQISDKIKLHHYGAEANIRSHRVQRN